MPAQPRDAATLLLLRDAPAEGLEVLMVRRHVRSEFAADVFAFPGGALEEEDLSEEAAELCRGWERRANPPGASPGNDADRDLALRLAAIRETFEETGILLAHPAGGSPASLPKGPGGMSSLRRELGKGGTAFVGLLKREGLLPAVELLVPFARWITPEAMPVRFDARFFLAEAPAGQEPLVDGAEISGCAWVKPAEALRRCREGDFPMLPPTVANLRELALSDTVDGAMDAARRREVVTVMPRVVSEGGRIKLILPGDPGYDG